MCLRTCVPSTSTPLGYANANNCFHSLSPPSLWATADGGSGLFLNPFSSHSLLVPRIPSSARTPLAERSWGRFGRTDVGLYMFKKVLFISSHQFLSLSILYHLPHPIHCDLLINSKSNYQMKFAKIFRWSIGGGGRRKRHSYDWPLASLHFNSTSVTFFIHLKIHIILLCYNGCSTKSLWIFLTLK